MTRPGDDNFVGEWLGPALITALASSALIALTFLMVRCDTDKARIQAETFKACVQVHSPSECKLATMRQSGHD